MGAAEAVPVVNEGLFSAIKHMKKAGIPVVGADMNGTPLTEARLSGPLALVMGGEGRGLSPTLRKHCDHIVSIPLAGQLESLNVSVAAALLMYEKRRQDGWFNEE
jgi:23S rRNA (guanosine2251-2'-O)-methyltransferase